MKFILDNIHTQISTCLRAAVGVGPFALLGRAGAHGGVQNRFKIEVAFGGVLGPNLGSKMDPTSSPRASQEASQTLLEKAWRGKQFSEAF